MSSSSKTPLLSRRHLLARAGGGFALLGLTDLLKQHGLLDAGLPAAAAAEASQPRPLNPLAPQPGHFTPQAKRVVWIFVNGGPSHVDTWDYRPALSKWNGKSIREFDPEFKNTTGFFKNAVGNLMQSPFKFSPQGERGKLVSEIFPHLGKHVDKMAFIHSGHTFFSAHLKTHFFEFPKAGIFHRPYFDGLIPNSFMSLDCSVVGSV